MLDAPGAMLDERRRLGQDKRDEMWDGVLHMVPPPGGAHQGLSSEFFLVVGPLAQSRGLRARIETGLFRAADDYRVPDQLFCREDQLSERGVEGAELVVEIRSPRDETYEKLDFYARLGVREVIVLHTSPRSPEVFRAVGGRLLPVQPASDGGLGSDVLGVRLTTVDGPVDAALRVTWDGGGADL